MKAILVGFMGSGKTTVGQLLAEQLHTTQSDLDDLVIQHAGKSIQDIFDEDGEFAFRRMEHEVLEDALNNTEGILSTGGGTPVQAANFELLKESDVPVILLNVKPETIMARLAGDNVRPLVKKLGLDGLAGLKAQRDSRYHNVSDVEIETDNLTPEEVVAAIRRFHQFELDDQADIS
ncbi:shikimate kinase [Secundilactobacillus paracollinoides]|uniref:Shikimate kinase n=1 Tax=Secundilactobacillus paracollinoides TaxID=240427 RepID=A0A1B2IWB3_9LACO|nr:shikimate kinase [Secundilactobacillus paracollinoides]ANZ60537.1 shikimate kinase [Secundilactobacillus paracollinoides]ANZ64850.1 shikimate kinase [Secundilactobacillus paracollinoides]ANZ66364.1 shikimate kinase [Secundilactobacillus paracollinoides]KRL79665.1 shikimate kinase [Secundilactobacillus paracollinoides DSM 15502 = JCM 11969]